MCELRETNIDKTVLILVNVRVGRGNREVSVAQQDADIDIILCVCHFSPLMVTNNINILCLFADSDS